MHLVLFKKQPLPWLASQSLGVCVCSDLGNVMVRCYSNVTQLPFDDNDHNFYYLAPYFRQKKLEFRYLTMIGWDYERCT